MSARNNAIQKVLPTKGDAAILGAGNTVDDLSVGQIGFFGDDNLSFAEPANLDAAPERFYIAVKGPNGEIRTSAGQFIPKGGILRPYNKKDYTAAQSMTATLSNFTAEVDTEYGFRVNFKNSHIERIFGYLNVNRSFVVKTPAYNSNNPGSDVMDPNELALLFYNEVLENSDDLLTPVFVAGQDITATNVTGISSDLTAGDEMTVAEVEALVTHNIANDDSLVANLQLTPEPSPIGERFGGINLAYHKLLETKIQVSALSDLNTSSIIINTTNITYEEGSGEDVMEKEYKCSRTHGGSPYRASLMTGLAIGDINYFAEKGTNYDQFHIKTNVKSDEGFLEYENPFVTLIAVPSGDNTTSAAVESFLYVIAG